MWANSSLISESGDSTRGVRLTCDPKQRRMTIERETNDPSGWNLQLSDQELVSDLLATLPKLKAAVDDHENRAPNWLRKSKSGDPVEVYELLPTRDGKGDDMDLVHSVVATIEIECHLNEVLNVLTSHKTNHDLEASMRAIIPKKKVRHGEVLLQPHATTLDGAPVRRIQQSSRGHYGKVYDQSDGDDDDESERKVLVSVSMTRFKSKRRLDVRGRLRNRHQRLQKLCLATLTHQFVGKQRAVHVIKTLPRSVHDQLAPIEEKLQSRSVLGSGLRGLDHISVGFDIQTRTVHCIGARGAAQSTRIIAHGYASITPPEQFGQQQQRTMTSYSPSELAHYRSTHINAEAKHVIELLTTSLMQFERVIRRRRLGLQTFIKIKPGDRDARRHSLQTCDVCNNHFSILRREHDCQLCGHVCCGECSKLYEVEGNVGQVSKKRLCVRCITNVDSCVFEDEDFMTALGPAVIDDDTDRDNDDEHESEHQEYDRRDDNYTCGSVGSTVTCSEFESGDSPDDVSTEFYGDSTLERSRALQTLDRLVNAQAQVRHQPNYLKRSRLTQSQLYQSHTQLSESNWSQSQSQFQQSHSRYRQTPNLYRDHTRDTQLTQSQLSHSQFHSSRETHLTQSQLSQSQYRAQTYRDTQLTQSQLNQSQSRFHDSHLTQSQLSQSQSHFRGTNLTESQVGHSKRNFPESHYTQSQSNHQFHQSRYRQGQYDDSIVAQLRVDVEDHLKRTLRATLQETKKNCAGADESQFSIAPLERDYQLEFDGSQTMSPSHPLPPKPLPAQERRRLHYVISSGALSPTYDRSALNMLAQIAATHLMCPIGYLTLIDQSTQYVVGLHPPGAISMSLPREESMCSYTIYHERPLVVKNALNDIRFSHMGFVSQTGLRFYAGFPIRAPDGAVVATICAADYKPHKYISAKQYAEMEALADLASTLIVTPDIVNSSLPDTPKMMSALLRINAAQRLHVASLFPKPGSHLSHILYPLSSPLNVREISQSRMLLKRKGGASAFVVKTSNWNRSKGNKSHNALNTKQKLKKDTAPHRTHQERTHELKVAQRINEHNAKEWAALERDSELTSKLDDVYDYLNNSGAISDYIYAPEPNLADVDHLDALHKLNAIAQGDPNTMKEVKETQLTSNGDLEVAGNEEVQHELTVDDYNFLLRVYALKGLHKEANALLTRMEKNLESIAVENTVVHVKPTDNTELELLDALLSVPHVISPDAKSYMLYATALGENGHAAHAVRVIGRMKERGIKPTVAVYNAVMRACTKAKRLPWAYNVMEKMQVSGFVPDRASFTILMNAAICEGDLDKAFETFHLMRTHVTEPDEVAFSCLINGFAREGRVERALNLYEDLLECGLTPSLVTFNTLMNACAKSHYYAHKALDFYYEMQELYDYRPDLYSYTTVLHACAKHGDFIQAEQIISHMERHHVPMTEFVYNTLFNVYARAQLRTIVNKAPRNQKALIQPEPVYQEPLEWDDEGNEIDLTRPGKETFSFENANYDASLDEDDAEEDEMNESESYKLKPEALAQVERLRQKDQAEFDKLKNAETTNLVKTERSMEVYGEEDKKLFADSEESLNFELIPMDLSDFGKFQTLNIKRAEARFHEMTFEKGLNPSVITLNSMISVYANALRLRSAEVFLKDTFSKFDLKPNEFTYRTMMQMYVRAKRTMQAEQLIELVRSEIDSGDLEADDVTFGLLVDHYARKRLMRRALTTLEEADTLGLQLQEKHLKKIRALTENYGIFSDLIPEDPNAVLLAGSRHKLMEKRKVRAQVLEYNRKIGKRYLLPNSV
ncbi:putative T-complex protein 1, eta subunit [Plasmopara halstedii]